MAEADPPAGGQAPGRLIRREGQVVLVLERPFRAVSATIVGGGIGPVRTWLNLQVPLDYTRTDPAEHLREAGGEWPTPLSATMTAAEVGDVTESRVGGAWVVATVGLSVPLAAAGSLLEHWSGPGTINIAAVLDVRLTDAGLVNALQTLTEAKAQALADAAVPAVNHDGAATGTATDSVLLACPPTGPATEGTGAAADPAGAATDFAGTATAVGHDLAVATHACISEGIRRWRSRSR